MLRRPGLLLLVVGYASVASLVARPAAPTRAAHVRRAAARPPLAAPGMQVAEPPVKVPEKVPELAPTQPKGEPKSGKGKKYKLLLFNDNVNR